MNFKQFKTNPIAKQTKYEYVKVVNFMIDQSNVFYKTMI